MIRQSVLPVGHHTTLFTVSPSTHEYNWVPAYCKDNLMGILEGGGHILWWTGIIRHHRHAMHAQRAL